MPHVVWLSIRLLDFFYSDNRAKDAPYDGFRSFPALDPRP